MVTQNPNMIVIGSAGAEAHAYSERLVYDLAGLDDELAEAMYRLLGNSKKKWKYWKLLIDLPTTRLSHLRALQRRSARGRRQLWKLICQGSEVFSEAATDMFQPQANDSHTQAEEFAQIGFAGKITVF